MSFRKPITRIKGRSIGAAVLAICLSSVSSAALADMSRSGWDRHGSLADATAPHAFTSDTGALWFPAPWNGGIDVTPSKNADRSTHSTTPGRMDEDGPKFADAHSPEWIPISDYDLEAHDSFGPIISDRWVAPDEFGALYRGRENGLGVVNVTPEPTSVLMGGIAALLLTMRPRKRTV